MIDHELDLAWLRQQQLSPGSPEPTATAQARDALLQHMSSDTPLAEVTPLPRQHRLRRLVPAVGVAAIAVAIAMAMLPASPGHRPPASAHSTHPTGPLVRLADYLAGNDTQATGDATLVLRTQNYPSSPSITGADLYTDSGEYFYSETESGLPEQITQNNNLGDGMFAREAAAALEGETGNVQTAAYDMAVAPNPTVYGQRFSGADRALHAGEMDNMVWEDSLDAFISGAGNAQAREGILRILATIPSVTVTNTTTDGQPTLTVKATSPDVPTNYYEQLVLNAQTGVPVSFQGGAPGQTPGVTVSYQVSRVTTASIAAGQF
jgi:hypothetical protein